MNEKELFFQDFNNSMHRLGRVTLIVMTALLVAVPFIYGSINSVSPSVSGFLSGLAKVGLIYYPVAIVEFLVYTPMLGVGGSYLSFMTGNVTNMRIPCVMNAKDIAGTEAGTPEHEIISTIAVATSAITTTLVIVVGVVCMVPLQPILQSEVLLPAFNNVVPALFGALGLKYFAKSPQIAIIPLVLVSLLCIFVPSMINQSSLLMMVSLLCIFVPSMINQSSLLMIPCGALALGIGFVLFKKGKL